MQSGDDSSRLIETLSQPGGRRFALVSLGCAKNTVDSEGIGQLLAAQGYEQIQETTEKVRAYETARAAKTDLEKAAERADALKQAGIVRLGIKRGESDSIARI